MTYLAGISFPGHERFPAIHCDGAGCGAVIRIDGLPPRWFLDGKPKRGWVLIREPGEKRLDFCPNCRTPEPVAATPSSPRPTAAELTRIFESAVVTEREPNRQHLDGWIALYEAGRASKSPAPAADTDETIRHAREAYEWLTGTHQCYSESAPPGEQVRKAETALSLAFDGHAGPWASDRLCGRCDPEGGGGRAVMTADGTTHIADPNASTHGGTFGISSAKWKSPAPDATRPHIVDGEFQSDKYPTTPRGKVPLSVKDPTAQDLLWEYAARRQSVDADFGDDLRFALRNAGYGEWRNLRAEARVALGGDYCMVDGALTEDELETLDRVKYSLWEAVKVGRQESAEALGRAEARVADLTEQRDAVMLCARAWQERAEKAEARLAAWEPVVRAAIAWWAISEEDETEEGEYPQITALERAVDALPAEHRPKTGGEGG